MVTVTSPPRHHATLPCYATSYELRLGLDHDLEILERVVRGVRLGSGRVVSCAVADGNWQRGQLDQAVVAACRRSRIGQR